MEVVSVEVIEVSRSKSSSGFVLVLLNTSGTTSIFLSSPIKQILLIYF